MPPAIDAEARHDRRMGLYSPYPHHRSRQIVADALGVMLTVLIITIAVVVAESIRALGAVGRGLEDAGESISGGLTDAGNALGGIPLVGDAVRAPFDAAATAGGSVTDAGTNLVVLIDTLATVVGWLIALPALLVLLLVWVLPRIRFSRRSAEARRLIAAGLSVETLAVRALFRAPLATLASVHPDAGGAWRDGDPRVIRDLAGLELRRLGIPADALP